jgi:U2-associated protein SR140
MAFKFSLGTAKVTKAQSHSKAKEEEEEKARRDKDELDKVMAEFQEEHGAEKSVLGEAEREEPEVFVPTGSKRHFTGRARTMKSGPGTLNSEPLDGYGRPGAALGRPAPQTQSRFGGAVPTGPAAMEGPKQTENVFTTVVAKASNLPPAITESRVRELFTEFPSLKIKDVEKIPPHGPSVNGRPSASMKVIFDKDVTARDLDDAMNKLNDKKYLGKGYYLHLDRYLGGRAVETVQHPEPFGARWQAPEVTKGFAPPPDLGGAGGGGRDRPRDDMEQLIVTANQPPDAATLRLVHQTIEGVILGGVEFEAALMNDPQIREEERFAWLYDQKHPVNRYYRWRLHQIVCDSPDPEIFAGRGDWRGPVDPLADEFANHLGAFDSDDDSFESEDEDEKEKSQFKPLPVGDNYPGRVDNGHGIMSPRSRAMFLWLLTSLPPGSIVADDIAAISNFAVEHAGQGMDEVISILVSNIIQPFQLTDANLRNRVADAEGKDDARRPNLQQVTLNALRIISDVLLVTAKEPGVAYKYRIAIGTQLVDGKAFEHLEQLPTQLEMGRITQSSYRDEVNLILKVWQDEHLFDESTLSHLDEAFNARERQKEEEEQTRKLAERRKRKGNIVRKAPTTTTTDAEAEAKAEEEQDTRMDIDEGEDDAATPGTDAELVEETTEPTPQQDVPKELSTQPTEPEIPGETAAARARRLRPKAEDMFASDEE